MATAVIVSEDQITIRVVLQPKSSRDAIIGLHGDECKIAVTAPPVEGKANKHLIKFLAKEFGVAKSRVRITKGELSRHKTLVIDEPARLPDILRPLL